MSGTDDLVTRRHYESIEFHEHFLQLLRATGLDDVIIFPRETTYRAIAVKMIPPTTIPRHPIPGPKDIVMDLTIEQR